MNTNLGINQLVSGLAQELGVAVDKVYPMLYKQAMIDGVWDIIWVVLCGLGLFIVSKWLMWVKNEVKKSSGRHIYKRDWYDYFVHIMFICLLFICLPFPFFFCLKDALDIFINTDWYIIQYATDYMR